MAKLISRIFVRQRTGQQFYTAKKTCVKRRWWRRQKGVNTYVALAKTKVPPASPPPQQAQPIPRVHAIVLSSFADVHTSNRSTIHDVRDRHEFFKVVNAFVFLPIPTPVLEEAPALIPANGTELISLLELSTPSNLIVNSKSKSNAVVIAKKKPSHPPRRHK